jgi:hypothetical protein
MQRHLPPRLRRAATLILATAGAFSSSAAQPPSPAPVTLTPAIRTELIERSAAMIDSLYVFPDAGRTLAGELRAALARGDYDALASPSDFASRLTADMRRVSGDLHFALLTPAAARQLTGAGPRVPQPDRMRQIMESERRANFHFTRTELLPGSVAYVRLDQFPVSVDSARPIAAAVMAQVGNADALILDFRRNPGGGEGLNQLLSSYLFDPDTTRVLYERTFRDGRGARITVLGDIPGRRLTTMPVYILTSRRTGSAAENMAYHLQAARRAMVVGERTAGAANTSRPHPVAHGFAVVIPIARVISPITRANWEGTGVQPNVRTAPDSALDVAHGIALDSLLVLSADAEPTRREVIRRVAGVARARRLPPRTDFAGDSAYRGRYGDWTVSPVNGQLLLANTRGTSLRVSFIDRDLFGQLDDPGVQFRFMRDDRGRITGLQLLQPSGEWTTVPRTDTVGPEAARPSPPSESP